MDLWYGNSRIFNEGKNMVKNEQDLAKLIFHLMQTDP